VSYAPARIEFETNRRASSEAVENKLRKEWRAQGDDLRTFLADFVAAVPQFDHGTALTV
jgi:hypothetical protein